ncbi:MAG: hypothetical protein HZA94_00730 [Candidatus Vogelbacteria bacterium]|nr:hypothetical protein [Candidatus Vogelbacteria bacterium]
MFYAYLPVTAYADGIVPSCPLGVCKFADFQQLGTNLLAFLISILLPLAIIGISIVGVKLVMSADNAKGTTEAKASLLNVLLGIAVAVGAIIIVQLIFSTLGAGSSIPDING